MGLVPCVLVCVCVCVCVCVRVCAQDHMMKLAISYALAQSTKLSVYENQVQDIVLETKHLPEQLADKGECVCVGYSNTHTCTHRHTYMLIRIQDIVLETKHLPEQLADKGKCVCGLLKHAHMHTHTHIHAYHNTRHRTGDKTPT